MIRPFGLVLCVVLFGCGGARHEPAAEAPAADTPLKAPGEARVGDRTRCPVSGEEFVVGPSSPSVDYEGKTYYFCCPGCDAKFKAAPAKYLSRPGA